MHVAGLYAGQSRGGLRAKLALEQSACGCASLSVANTAECDRLLAEVAANLGAWDEANALVKLACAVYVEFELPIQIALCDLAVGQLRLARNLIAEAETHLVRARDTLQDVMPDVVWQCNLGLAECALRRQEPHRALDELMSGIRLIEQIRAPLPSERLSASFFGQRKVLFERALDLAGELGRWEDALSISEATKTTTFTLFLQARRRSLSDKARNDAHVSALLARESQLRQELAEIHQRIDITSQLTQPQFTETVSRGGQASTQPQLQENLRSLNRAYDETVDQLQLRTSDSQGTRSTFSLPELRRLLNARVGENWLCLVYQETDAGLFVFSLTSRRLSGQRIQPTRLQRAMLKQACSQEPDMRELIYRGTLGGTETNSSPGEWYLQELFAQLVPQELHETIDSLDLLAVVPSGVLHGLPFQALFHRGKYLIERAPIVYAPTLHALQVLLVSIRLLPQHPLGARPACSADSRISVGALAHCREPGWKYKR